MLTGFDSGPALHMETDGAHAKYPYWCYTDAVQVPRSGRGASKPLIWSLRSMTISYGSYYQNSLSPPNGHLHNTKHLTEPTINSKSIFGRNSVRNSSLPASTPLVSLQLPLILQVFGGPELLFLVDIVPQVLEHGVIVGLYDHSS